METQPSESEKMDDKTEMPLADMQNENPQSSRFSRRRFIQSGIAVSPLLVTDKVQPLPLINFPAHEIDNTENCSHSVLQPSKGNQCGG